MEYEYVKQAHLNPADFCVDRTSNDLTRGHCMWGGSDMAAHDWCGVKVQNPAGSNVEMRRNQGVIDGRLYGFAVYQGMDEGKKLAPETLMSGLWVCENHDKAFKDLHKDWAHTLVTFAVPDGAVYAVEPVEVEQMFEVSFRYYTVDELTGAQLNAAIGETMSENYHGRVEYLKVIGPSDTKIVR